MDRTKQPVRELRVSPWRCNSKGLNPRFLLRITGTAQVSAPATGEVDLFQFFDTWITRAPAPKGKQLWWLTFTHMQGAFGTQRPMTMQQISAFFKKVVVFRSSYVAAMRTWRWEPGIIEPKEDVQLLKYVYFVQAEEGGLIKIGITKNPHMRLSTMQTNCPVLLQTLRVIPAHTPVEKTLHRLFRNQRVRGEWFRPESSLVELIRAVPKELFGTKLKKLGEPKPLETQP